MTSFSQNVLKNEAIFSTSHNIAKKYEVSMSGKHEKFKRLAESRVNRAISDVRSIAKLSNKSHYEYTEDEVKKIYATLKGELDGMRDAFLRSATVKKPFRL